MQIYVHRHGQQLGPYSAEEVRQYLADGDLSADDLAWHEGATDWIPLAQIEGVASVTGLSRTKTPSWVPQRRGEADADTPVRFAEPMASAVTREPSPMPSPVAEDLPSEDAGPKKRQLSPIEKRRRKEKETGKQLMGFGALVFFCGAGTTLLTFCAAVGQGGGVFVVFIGLIATGVLLFVAGYKKYTGT